MLKVNEIFKSIQGESTYSGLPCTFIRLTGCNLRCSYCDTAYAYETGDDLTIEEILSQVRKLQCSLIEITGGEPLLQEKEVARLATRLLEERRQVLLETNGSMDINCLPAGVVKIIDIKCPSSGMSAKMDWGNIGKLSEKDEIKFVLSHREDYQWAKDIISRYNLADKATLLFSPVYDKLSPADLANWIINDALPVRLQLQLHKYVDKK